MVGFHASPATPRRPPRPGRRALESGSAACEGRWGPKTCTSWGRAAVTPRWSPRASSARRTAGSVHPPRECGPRSPGALGAQIAWRGRPLPPARGAAGTFPEGGLGRCRGNHRVRVPAPLPAFRKFALRRHFTLGEHLRLHLFAPTANGKKSGDGRFNEKGRKVGITAVSGAPRSVCPAGSARSGRRRGWACCAP